MKLTKTVVDNLLLPDHSNQIIYRDNQLRGFALRITSNGVKSFIVEKRTNKKLTRITLGRYGDLTVEQARKEAQKILGKIVTGINPVAEKQAARISAITLKEVFNDYINSRKSLKAKTLYDYEKVITTALSDWLNKPLFSITKDDVLKKHTQLGQENGPAYASFAMRILRAIFNFAIAHYENTQGQSFISENPIDRLSKTRAWYRVKRRKSYIKPHQLSAWYQHVMQLDNEVVRDFLLFVLLTGLRRNEAAQLEKSHVDLKAKLFTVIDTKNHEQHTLPLPEYLCELLARRIKSSPNQYIFHGNGEKEYLIEPRKQMNKIIDETGIQFTIQDLRRTFITIAESLDISAYALKRLLNHKMDDSDVTAGYIVTDVERLRKPMQQICDYIMTQCLTCLM